MDSQPSTVDYSIDQREVRRNIGKLIELGEVDARLFYGTLAECAKVSVSKNALLERLAPPARIRDDAKKYPVWVQAAEYFASIVAGNGGRLVWELYECLPTEERFKLLGQHFTPQHVGKFALSGLRGLPTTILDPMAGHGIFLQQAKARYPSAQVVGVDIDNLPLTAARLVLDKETRLVCDDVFKWARDQVANASDFGFSAVVGNPAYVSYQNLSMVQNVTGKIVTGGNYRDWLLETLKDIAKEKAVDSELASLFKIWSGYSDLSAYAMILAWLLVENGGQIAFVMSNHWMERKYGLELRRFLSSHGTIRGIVTHRAGNWFPRAQIPASIFVYTKGLISERQRSKGIPYVEIDAPSLSDVGAYLNSMLKEDFWQWIDKLDQPGKHGSLHVTFKRWQEDDSRSGLNRRAQNLIFPPSFPQQNCSSLTDAGWQAHQGVRTGCNEVFYVQISSENSELHIAHQTLRGEKRQRELFIPRELLTPVIRRLSSKSKLVIGREQADACLLNLANAILKEDKAGLNEYPREWLRKWGIESLKIIPEQLAHYLSERALTPYEGKGKIRGTVISLSAVRTNIYKPPRKSANLPRRPRFWYQVPIQHRHHGRIIIPRVVSGYTRAFLVRKPESILIDANFTTFNSKPDAVDAKRMWVWFNSNTFRALCELNGVPLGGGALKLEAELLSQIPVPRAVKEKDESTFNTASRMLETPQMDDEHLLQIGEAIDESLFGTELAAVNLEVLTRLTNQRRRITSVESDESSYHSPRESASQCRPSRSKLPFAANLG
jgi:hypothetical protein